MTQTFAQGLAQARDVLRSGAWLTRERVRLVVFGLLAAMLIAAVYLVATSDGLNDRFGRPLGTDFSNVYAAGTYVLDGDATAPFKPPRQYAREQAIFGQDTPFYGWHYPPYFLALAAMLAAMPYALALALWQGVTFALYLWITRAILRTGKARALADPLWLPLVIGFPAVFVNLGHGHNGFLTAALFGAALLQLDRKPVLAGVLFGCIVYKPQFGLLIPVALAAGNIYRTWDWPKQAGTIELAAGSHLAAAAMLAAVVVATGSAGAVGGLGGLGIVYGLFSVFRRSEGAAPFQLSDLVGRAGSVAVSIPAGHRGSVYVKAEGQTHEFSATAASM